MFTLRGHSVDMQSRLDNREEMDAAICDILDRGQPIEGLDVSLSRMGAVDLDLLVACLNEMKHRMAAGALADLKADAAFDSHDIGLPLQIVA